VAFGELLNTGTWRWDWACATWVFQLAAPGRPLIEAMAVCAGQLLHALPGFALPATAEWTTESGGEDAVMHPRGTRIDNATIAATFRDHRDVIHLALDLDLQLVEPTGGAEVVLVNGARLHLEREDELLALWLNLNVDLYARRTFGANRDNDQLARSNAPRLADFLDRLTTLTGARLDEVDAPSYTDQVCERGFVIPPPPEPTSP
jgi:hypothetical protein